MKKLLVILIFLLLISINAFAQDQKKDILELAGNLESCQACTQKFTHPFTGESLEKRIEGIIDGECLYIEEMPNKGKMECRYSEESRKAVAQYYRDLAGAESFGTKANTSAGTGKSEITYTIDGKEVKNPLQECMNDGTCVVSGY